MAKKQSGTPPKPGSPGMADVEWYGQTNCDLFFKLHDNFAGLSTGFKVVGVWHD